MDMGDEIDGYRRRVEAARRDVAALPRLGWGRPGPADEETGERWDRGNVLGHTAEMLPLWTAQVRAVAEEGSTVLGRDELGYVRRREGIDHGRDAGEEELIRRIDAGLADLLDLLARLRPEDLDRVVTLQDPRTGPRDMSLGDCLERLLVGHVEAHLRQLAELA
jgi:hypothetical protein